MLSIFNLKLALLLKQRGLESSQSAAMAPPSGTCRTQLSRPSYVCARVRTCPDSGGACCAVRTPSSGCSHCLELRVPVPPAPQAEGSLDAARLACAVVAGTAFASGAGCAEQFSEPSALGPRRSSGFHSSSRGRGPVLRAFPWDQEGNAKAWAPEPAEKSSAHAFYDVEILRC